MKIRVHDEYGLEATYHVDDELTLRELKFKLKKNFRDQNSTDKILSMGLRDKTYERYCDEIDKLKL